MAPEPEVARIRIEGADAALHSLLEEWLAEQACRVVEKQPELVLVDLPLSPQDSSALVRRLRERYPHTPLVALSSRFFARVEASGAVAKALGVEAVLPKPLARGALVSALRKLLPQLG